MGLITEADREAAEKFIADLKEQERVPSYYELHVREGALSTAFQAGIAHERAKVDELVRAVEMIASRTVEPFFEGIDPNSSLGLSMYADSALKQFSGRSG